MKSNSASNMSDKDALRMLVPCFGSVCHFYVSFLPSLSSGVADYTAFVRMPDAAQPFQWATVTIRCRERSPAVRL